MIGWKSICISGKSLPNNTKGENSQKNASVSTARGTADNLHDTEGMGGDAYPLLTSGGLCPLDQSTLLTSNEEED